jgi:hypothetical protein
MDSFYGFQPLGGVQGAACAVCVGAGHLDGMGANELFEAA